MKVLADPAANGEGTLFNEEIDGQLERLDELTQALSSSLKSQ